MLTRNSPPPPPFRYFELVVTLPFVLALNAVAPLLSSLILVAGSFAFVHIWNPVLWGLSQNATILLWSG